MRDFLARIERQYGKARRIWLCDRGVPTEEVLQEMRVSDPPVQYLVGTPIPYSPATPRIREDGLIGSAKLNGLDPEVLKHTCVKCSRASPSTRSTGSMNS